MDAGRSDQRQRLAAELTAALASERAFQAWLADRGYTATPRDPLADTLKLAQRWTSLDHPAAPRLLVFWQEDFTAVAARGQRLRKLQHDAYHLRSRIAVMDAGGAPELAVVGCRHFVLLFPLDTDPFARRQRYTADQIRESAGLAQRYTGLTAQAMARWGASTPVEATPDDSSDDWSGLFAATRRFDWEAHLYGGAQLDQAFVAFIGQERQRLLEAVLDPGRQDEVLRPMLRALEVEDAGTVMSTDLLRRPALRKRVIAAADTVLLRLVL
ncbi:MAG: hypothetical protein KC549_15225, partial [Myxococcales bacterium]|nr:hypothetical protein [Myxococcales bacterium]